MKGIALALTLAVAVASGTEQASAVTYQVTYDGTISSGYDSSGRFGPANTDLAGKVTATYIFDTATPGASYTSIPGYSQLYGGTSYAIPNPLLSATLTVNGVSTSLPTNLYGYTFAYFAPPGSYNDYYVETQGTTGISYFRVTSSTNSFGGPYLYSPFSHSVASGDSQYGYFGFASGDYGYVNVTSVTVGPVSEVPLPAALPLFLGGVGAMAWVASRRRQKLRVAA